MTDSLERCSADIVVRLRQAEDMEEGRGSGLYRQAADEIERQRRVISFKERVDRLSGAGAQRAVSTVLSARQQASKILFGDIHWVDREDMADLMDDEFVQDDGSHQRRISPNALIAELEAAQPPAAPVETFDPSGDRYVHIDNVVYHLDDIEVDADGKCAWTDVANALTHIRLCVEIRTAPHPLPRSSAGTANKSCPHDMGFDRELGPVGCRLVGLELECVCERINAVPQPVSVWHPIESFPRDGEHYLADDDRVAGGFPQIVYFDEDTGRLRVPDADISYELGFFTHWTICPLASALPRPQSGGK